MKKLLRTIVVLLLLLVTASVVFTQTRLMGPAHAVKPPAQKERVPTPAEQVAQLAHASPSPALSPAAPAPGSESAPLVVRIAGMPDAESQMAEQESNRQIERSLVHYTARLANTALAQNILSVFQSIILFLLLAVLYMIVEQLRKIAKAAARSAEAAEAAATRRDVREPRSLRAAHSYRKR